MKHSAEKKQAIVLYILEKIQRVPGRPIFISTHTCPRHFYNEKRQPKGWRFALFYYFAAGIPLSSVSFCAANSSSVI